MKNRPVSHRNPARVQAKVDGKNVHSSPKVPITESEQNALAIYNSRPYSPHNFHQDPNIHMGVKTNSPPVRDRLNLKPEVPKPAVQESNEEKVADDTAEKVVHSPPGSPAPPPIAPPNNGPNPRIQRKKQEGNEHPTYDPNDPDGKVIHFYYDLDQRKGSKSVSGIKPTSRPTVRAFILHLTSKQEEIEAIELDAQGYFLHTLARYQLDLKDFEVLAEFLWLDYLNAYEFLSYAQVLKQARSLMQPKHFLFKSGITTYETTLYASPDAKSEALAWADSGVSLVISEETRGWSKVMIDRSLLEEEKADTPQKIAILSSKALSSNSPSVAGYIRSNTLEEVAISTIIQGATIEVNEKKVARVKELRSDPAKALLAYQNLSITEKRFVDSETRFLLVRYMVGDAGWKAFLVTQSHVLGQKEEELINELIKFGDPQHQDDLFDLLIANQGQNFKMLEGTFYDEEYKKFHETLGGIAEEGVSFEQKAAFAGSLMKQGSKSKSVIVWSDPGVIRENYDVQVEYSVKFTEANNIKVTWTRFDPGEIGSVGNWTLLGVATHALQKAFGEKETRIFKPDEPVAVRFLLPEEELHAKAGEIRIIPAITLFRLRAKELRQEVENKADLGLMAIGAGEVAGVAKLGTMGWRGLAGLADMVWGGTDLVVNEYGEELSATDAGKEFLFTWNLLSSLITVYGISRLVAEAPDLIYNLWNSWDAYKAERNLKKIHGNYDHLDEQVEGTIEVWGELEAKLLAEKVDADELASLRSAGRGGKDGSVADAGKGSAKKSAGIDTGKGKADAEEAVEDVTPEWQAGEKRSDPKGRGLKKDPQKSDSWMPTDEMGRKYRETPDGHHVVRIEVRKGVRVAVICSRCKDLISRNESLIRHIKKNGEPGLKKTTRHLFERLEKGNDEEKILITLYGYSFLNEVRLQEALKMRLSSKHPNYNGYKNIINRKPGGSFEDYLQQQTNALINLRSTPKVKDQLYAKKGFRDTFFKSKDRKGKKLKTPTQEVRSIPKGELPPQKLTPIHSVFSMQSSIGNVTGEINKSTGLFDYTVLTNAMELRSGKLTPEILGPIKIWKEPGPNGKIWTLDHRRLMAYKIAGYPDVPTEWAHEGEVLWDNFKMSTEKTELEWGKNVEIRVHLNEVRDNDISEVKREILKSKKGDPKTWLIKDSESGLPIIIDQNQNKFTIDQLLQYYYISSSK